MIPEQDAGQSQDDAPGKLQPEHRKKTLERVRTILFQKDRQRNVVDGTERKIFDYLPEDFREKCQRDRCAGKQQDDRLFDDVDAPGGFGVQADRRDDHFHTEVDDQGEHGRDHEVQEIDPHGDRAVRDDHDDDEGRNECQCEEDDMRSGVTPESIGPKVHRFQKVKNDLSRLDRAAHIPDNEHLEEVKKSRGQDQVDHGVGKRHAVHDVRTGRGVDRFPEEIDQHQIYQVGKERDRGAETVLERFHDPRPGQCQMSFQIHLLVSSFVDLLNDLFRGDLLELDVFDLLLLLLLHDDVHDVFL